MPNHVENRLTFDCSRERLQEILTAIARDEDKTVDGKYGIGTFDFEKVIPIPEDIYRGNLGQTERELYGKKNWYDWSVWNWGRSRRAMRRRTLLTGQSRRLSAVLSGCPLQNPRGQR